MKWIKCSDMMPEITTEENIYWTKSADVLVIDEQKRQWVANFKKGLGLEWWGVKNDNDSCCECVNPDFKKCKITHWMTLPEAPEE